MIHTTTIMIFFGFMALALVLIAVMKIKSLTGKTDAGEFVQLLSMSAVRYANMEHRTRLDFSVDSVFQVIEILTRLHERHASGRLTGKAVRSEANIWGAYVGEAIRRRNGGRWERHVRQDGKDRFVLVVDEKRIADPFEWCHDTIINGPDRTVWDICRSFFPPDDEPGSTDVESVESRSHL